MWQIRLFRVRRFAPTVRTSRYQLWPYPHRSQQAGQPDPQVTTMSFTPQGDGLSPATGQQHLPIRGRAYGPTSQIKYVGEGSPQPSRPSPPGGLRPALTAAGLIASLRGIAASGLAHNRFRWGP